MTAWKYLTSWWRREFPRHPTRRAFVDGVATLLQARYGVAATTAFMRRHPLGGGLPEVQVALPNGEMAVIEFNLCRLDWPDIETKGFSYVPDMEMIALLDWRDRLAQANPDVKLHMVHVTDRDFTSIDTISFHRYGLDVLSGVWADPWECERHPETGGARDTARWLGRLFKLTEEASHVGAA